MEPRQLIIMRHATADAGRGRDRDRPLTPLGLDEARRVGVRLRELGPSPDRVLCSTALRCRETCRSLLAGLGREPSVEFDEALYNADAGGLLDAIAHVVEPRRVLLIAHNPGVSMLALSLSAGREGEASGEAGGPAAGIVRGFAPATIACFRVESEWAELSPASARIERFERAPLA